MPNTAVAAAHPTSQEATCWLALSLTQGLGPTRIKKLVEHFGRPDRVLQASLTELEATGMLAVSAQSIATGKSLDLAQQECAKASESGARIVALSDPEYPARLKEIYDPPVVLYARGNVELLAKPGIAVVGTRHPTPYGTGMSERLSIDLAAHGLVIISGMARGVDTAAHRGAISAKGKTIAIFGTGIDVMYPKENTRRRPGFRISGGHIRRSAELSDPQPHHKRHVSGRAGGGSGGIQWHSDYIPLRPGAEPRRLRGPGQRHE